MLIVWTGIVRDCPVLNDLAPFRADLEAGERYLLLWCHAGTVEVRYRAEVDRLTGGRGILLPPGTRAGVTVAPGSVAVPVRIAAPEICDGGDAVERLSVGDCGRDGWGRQRWNDWVLHQFSASVSPLREPGHRAGDCVRVLRGLQSRVPGPPLPQSAGALEVALALTRDPACPRTVSQWAEEVATGERTLHRMFVTETGLTFGGWRRQCRLAAAARLLLSDRSRPVSEIAGSVGFGTPTGFIRAFRRCTGATPSEWRTGDGAGTRVDRSLSTPPGWGGASSPPGLDHGFHLLLWVYRGRMLLRTGDLVNVVGEGQVVWMPAYRGHEVLTAPGSVVLPLTFTVGQVCPDEGTVPVAVDSGDTVPLLQHVVANQSGLGPGGYDSTAVPEALFGTVVTAGADPAPAPVGTVEGTGTVVDAVDGMPVQVRQVADAVLRDLRSPAGLDRWAVSVGWTPRKLNAGFREWTGMTFLRWRATVRLQTARRLIAYGSAPSEAAKAVGYRHLSQFSREFKARFGVSPRNLSGVMSGNSYNAQ